VFRGRANLCQHRVVICIAVTIEELLVGAERSDPALDFFAKLTATNRRWARSHDKLDRPFYLGGFIQRNGLKAAFGFRRLPGDGLNKRHGLRDQKIAFSLPFHRIPQPPSSQQKAGESIKPRFSPDIRIQHKLRMPVMQMQSKRASDAYRRRFTRFATSCCPNNGRARQLSRGQQDDAGNGMTL
jgi:hypothetical protein